jgi:hypothetical protein
MVAHAFTPERAEEMRSSIQDKVSQLLDGLLAAPKPVDLQESFSLPLAFQVRSLRGSLAGTAAHASYILVRPSEGGGRSDAGCQSCLAEPVPACCAPFRSVFC